MQRVEKFTQEEKLTQKEEKFTQKEEKSTNEKKETEKKVTEKKVIENINQCNAESVSRETSKDIEECICPAGKTMKQDMQSPIMLYGNTINIQYWCE